jgi:RNA recognition motif-containing protein
MNIYVGNLPYTMTDQELRTTFERFGEVRSAKIIMDRATNRSKGFGFVEMASQSDGEAAIKGLDGQPLNGRPLRVNPAAPRDEQRGGGGGGGGGPRGDRRPPR